jgi:hypothetical protein
MNHAEKAKDKNLTNYISFASNRVTPERRRPGGESREFSPAESRRSEEYG